MRVVTLDAGICVSGRFWSLPGGPQLGLPAVPVRQVGNAGEKGSQIPQLDTNIRNFFTFLPSKWIITTGKCEGVVDGNTCSTFGHVFRGFAGVKTGGASLV